MVQQNTCSTGYDDQTLDAPEGDRHFGHGRHELNVGGAERWGSLIGGGLLAYAGLKKFSFGGLAMMIAGGALAYRGATGHCSVYQRYGVNTARRGKAQPHEFFEHGIHVEQAVTINRRPDELYSFWRDFENLPRFMDHLKSVEVIDEKRSRWTAKAPAGTSVAWDAEIINEEENALIAWRSLEDADVQNAGSVRFVPAPGGRGTEVKVVIEYIPPAGALGAAVARLFGEEPSQQVKDDLRRFKQLMETGGVPTVEGQPSGDAMARSGHRRLKADSLLDNAGGTYGRTDVPSQAM